jgi:hypothetical protein
MRGIVAANLEEHKAMMAQLDAKIAEGKAWVADATERVERAKDRLDRLGRGEAISGGLHKRMDMEALLDQAGVTKRQRRRWTLLGDLNAGRV